MNGFRSLQRYPSGARLQQMIIAQAQFVAMTKVIEDNLRAAGVPAEKIHRIPNGIAAGEVGPPKRNTDVSGSPPTVLFVGNLYQQPAKGIDILLKAWKVIQAGRPEAVLKVVGEGDLPAYQAYAEKLGIADTVRFLGKQANAAAFYQEAQVFVLPSRREGMSNALMEAMLAGLPCVATDISGSQDLIQSGVNGLLVPPADIEALAKGIEYMLAHPAEARQMGLRARQTIIEKNDIRVVADEYIALYAKLQ
jgi:glycosyltransferase involved in cell wall biosynthesis